MNRWVLVRITLIIFYNKLLQQIGFLQEGTALIPLIEDDLKNEDNLKYEDDLKYEDNLKC